MAKKKTTAKKSTAKKTTRKSSATRKTTKKTAAKKTTAKKPARKKPAPPKAKKKAPAKKSTTRKKPATKAATKKAPAAAPKMPTPATKKPAPKKAPARKKKSTALGRPRIPGDAKLDLVFQKDYEARQIFEFLGIETVKELEHFGPDEIIQRLKAPLVKTVGRIRKILAVANRSLANDTEFAIEFRQLHVPDEQ